MEKKPFILLLINLIINISLYKTEYIRFNSINNNENKYIYNIHYVFLLHVLGIIMLIIITAVFAGLTLGLMSLDKIGLEIIIGAGETLDATEKEKEQAKYAKKVAYIREDGNLLLTTLVLGNVASNSLLSILMADLTNGLTGFIISTMIILIFGEIIPQSICSRYPLLLGAKSVQLVKIIIFIFYIFAKPIAYILDKTLGKDIGTVYTKLELEKMLEIHCKQNAIDLEEVDIMQGAMRFKSKNVQSIMTPFDKIFMIPVTAKLGYKTIRDIYKSGYSRIPVWGKDKNDVVGILFVKDLIFVDPQEETCVLNFIKIFGRGVYKLWYDSKLGDALKLFKDGKCHLALVQDVNNTSDRDPFYEIKGLITLEDIVEEILQDEIFDETDYFHDNSSEKNRENFDYSRLRLLDARICDETLTSSEVDKIAKHLLENYSFFNKIEGFNGKKICLEDMKLLLLKSEVIEYGLMTTAGSEIITKDVIMDYCIVTVEGKVKIMIGKENFVLPDVAPISIFGKEALTDMDYIPDYTVKVADNELENDEKIVRAVKITRINFQQLLYPLNTIKKFENKVENTNEKTPLLGKKLELYNN